MSHKTPAVLVLCAVAVCALLVWLLRGAEVDPGVPSGGGSGGDVRAAAPASAELSTAAAAIAAEQQPGREVVEGGGPPTGVRGVVVDARTAQPLGGIEVVAIKDEPSLEPLIARFRGLFTEGMFVETRAVRRELGRTISNPDGTFEITGLPPGRVFLDGRSDAWFVRTPGTAALARGEIRDGLELRASPGGRVRGTVLGADGAPAPGAAVSLRPGLNAFLGQLTERQYRWLETMTDEQGRFDLPGVPPGSGYTATAAAPGLALEERHGVDVHVGQVTELVIQSHPGAVVVGEVVDDAGQPCAGANVALVYLDISRVLFSADGRSEPLQTDAAGRFRIANVAAGRVAFVAVAVDKAPSNIEELAVVDNGIYELVLHVGEGTTVRGRVIDDQEQPVAGAAVELRPFERPNDPQFLKMMLKIRRVETTTGLDGVFEAKGLTSGRLVIQASKPGYTTALEFGVALDAADITLRVQRGAFVRGVVRCGGEPVTRFRVETRSRPIPKPGEENVAEASERRRGMRFQFGPGGRDGRDGMPRNGRQLPEGQGMMDRGMDGNWQEIQAADGSFELRGIPPGRVRVRVRAEGYSNAAEQTVDLQPAQQSEVLAFELMPGLPVSGIVLDDATGQPVSDAQVTAYRQRDGGDPPRGMPFAVDIDPEDFDFLGLSSAVGRRSAITDSAGRFCVEALEPGEYRFTARHPDMAKASAKEVVIEADQPTPTVEIRLDVGGGVEGTVTGIGMRPLADALMVAFSIQAGTMRSSTTDKGGYYRIDGLPPGQYFVFKSRMDERADNIPLELLSNMRLKTVTVRKGRFTRLDLQDEGEDGVRVHGFVRENGAAVPRALVTLLGNDRDGFLGMGVRANAAGMDGRYELVGIKPGDYVAQVTRFQGQPVQTTFEITVPDEVSDYRFDIALPTSEVMGRVIDTRGNPVPRIMVTLGSADGALSGAGGLLGLIAQNGLSQARTNDSGEFTMRSVAAGSYRITAGSRFAGGPRRRGGGDGLVHGEGHLDGVLVDGSAPVTGLVVTVPIAGSITGLVVDGSGQPVAGAEITHEETSAPKRRSTGDAMLDLLGSAMPVRTDAEGRFAIRGLNPGLYDLRAEKGEAVEAGSAADVRVAEDVATDVTMTLVRGATLKLRATNVDRAQIPFANLSLLDGNGKPIVSRVSTLSVMRRLMGSRDEVADSGWYTFGSVPPDTYTLVIREPGKPEVRITRTIADGETVEWDIDVAAELEAQRGK